ncbi:hypothetical protein AK88_04839 [Plasmodium fragile]|uniref:Heptatricopeptide repeat-containing protein n=1 Tax=Plasmodium fragile TaxID=5857 RepID=A0A0D9QEP8_PLAFR|nr:uncharacterized protein AK88_04839 [Plasmodium fragile]KJP85530.1 hypothetical protein AK88_04839 [Plasmodium fragile]
MIVFSLKRSALALFLTLIANSFFAKKWTKGTNHLNCISPLHAHHESELAAHKGRLSFLWSSGGSVGSSKGQRTGRRRRGAKLNLERGGICMDGRLKAQNGVMRDKNSSEQAEPRAFTIRDIGTLVGGHVTVMSGAFKHCRGVILDIKKTDKDEYELLVVINRDEAAKYPKNILNKFGKSYWFNVKDLQVERVKDLLFHRYENFYDQKARPVDGDLQEMKERFSELGIEGEELMELNSEEENALEGEDVTDVSSEEENTLEGEDVTDVSSEEENTLEGEEVTDVSTEEENTLEGKEVTDVSSEEANASYIEATPRPDLITLQQSLIEGRKKRPRRSAFCHTVVKQIEKNYMYEDLLNLYKEKRHLANIVVCFYILKQLVKIYNFEKESENGPSAFLKNVIYSNTFEIILTDVLKFLQKKEIYRVVDKTWLLWILVKLKIHKEERYRSTFEGILNHLVKYLTYETLKKMNTKSLCAILWSLAKCSHSNIQICKKIYKKIVYFLDKYTTVMSCHDISNIYYSLGLVEYKNGDPFFNLIDEEIKKNINKFSVQNLMNILYGMTKLKRNNSTLAVVKDKLLFHSSNMNLRNMSLFLWCLNKNEYYHVDVNFKDKSFQHLNVKQAMQLLMFFNYNRHKYVYYLKYVLNFLFKYISKLTNQEISFLFYSLFKLNLLKSSKCFVKVRKHIIQRDYREFNLIDLNMILLSMNNSNVYDKILLNYLFRALRGILARVLEARAPRGSSAPERVTMPERVTTPIDCTNLNYVMKNLSEMKIFDQSIMLKYALLFSNNLAHISADHICDYLFYTLSMSHPGGKNQVGMNKEGEEKTQMTDCSKSELSAFTSRDQRIAQFVISNEEITLKEANFGKVYQHYLTKVTQFVKEKLSHFDAHTFLAHLEEHENGNTGQSGGGEKQEEDKIDTFVFNYQTEKKHEHVQKLNELILEQTTNHAEKATLLGDSVSDKEFSSFVNEAEDNYHHDNDENIEKKIKQNKKNQPCTSISSLIHLFYSLASLNELHKDRVDHYMDNLYTVVEKKKSEITAYQWLLIKDIFKMVRVKRSADWELLLDNVNTYVKGAEQEGSARFETINIEI